MTADETAVTLPGPPGLQARVMLRGKGLAIVAPPHPLYGGALDSPVVEALCGGFRVAGLATLRFNNRGVGQSSGHKSGELQDAVADYQTAVAWARAEGRSPTILAGYSFGALAALRVHLSGVPCAALAAVSPPSAGLTAERLAAIDTLYALCQGDEDHLVDVARTRELLSQVPRHRYTLLEGADHFLAFEADAVRAFAIETAQACAASERL